MTDRPRAAKRVCTKIPDMMPRTEIIPAFLPWAMLLPKIKRVSWPGVMFNNRHAAINSARFWVPYMAVAVLSCYLTRASGG